MQIMGVGGRAQAGKTELCQTIARLMVDRSYGMPKLLHFAGPLKDAAAILGAAKADQPELYRKFCQIVGTDMLRDPAFVPGVTGPDYWCNLMHLALLRLEAEEKAGIDRGEFFVLIDDIRFVNEAKLLRRWGATNVFLCADRRLKNLDAPFRRHESERLANDYSNGRIDEVLFDYSMTNNGDLEFFRAEIEKNMDGLLGGGVWRDS